ncbi:MAG: DNA-3-methyladenine glycosylase [Chloroflexota bacterium]
MDRALLARPTLEAARALLGARLVRDDATGRRVGRIVELEAYIGAEDRASHARFGPTARNSVMFGPPGIAYVYLVYGMYHCLNVVTEPPGRPAALLIRAIAPIEGIELMRAARLAQGRARRRSLAAGQPEAEARRIAALPVARLASGPGLVAAAFGLDRSWTGVDLCDPASPLRLERRPAGEPEPTILAAPRIGIAYAGEPWTRHPWRLLIAGDPAVSVPARGE